MKVVYFIILSLLSVATQAQLYVSPNSYVYVNDQYVTVTQAVNLAAANSNVYLRNNGQLIQKTMGAGTNVGDGALSVYQEGTVNNYCYNYWASPVGGANATVGNSNFSIAQLGLPNLNLDTRSFALATILPFTNYDGVSSNGAVSIASQWIWKYIQRSAYDPGGPNGWARASAANALLPGEGFTMKGSSGSDSFTPFIGSGANNVSGNGQRYDFRGKPNDGTITVPVDNAKLTLVGNPYPSAIDLQRFLEVAENPSIDGNALFWEHDKSVASHLVAAYKGGYGSYNGVTNIYTPAVYLGYDSAGAPLGSSTPLNTNTGVNAFKRRFVPIGQGFMVRGNALATVQFKNDYRLYVKEAVANNSQFERSSNTNNRTANSDFYDAIPNVAGLDYTLQSKLEAPHIKINTMLPNGAIRQNNLAFMSSAVDGYDRADAKSPDANNNLPFDVYFPMAGTEFIQSTTTFDINKKFALGFKNTAPANYRMRVGEMVNFTGSNEVYLHDKVNDVYHDILNADLNLNLPAGVNNTQYEITFRNASALNTKDDNLAENFVIFQNNTKSMLTVKNPLGLALKSIELFDISGKSVLSRSKVGSQELYEYATAGLSEGVYVAKITTDSNQVIASKVYISNIK